MKMINGFIVATSSMIKANGMYHMWFGYRKAQDNSSNICGYSIGYAFTYYGVEWQRRDDLCVSKTSADGLDSEMVCYPGIIKCKEKYYMCYCANGYGNEAAGVSQLINQHEIGLLQRNQIDESQIIQQN